MGERAAQLVRDEHPRDVARRYLAGRQGVRPVRGFLGSRHPRAGCRGRDRARHGRRRSRRKAALDHRPRGAQPGAARHDHRRRDRQIPAVSGGSGRSSRGGDDHARPERGVRARADESLRSRTRAPTGRHRGAADDPWGGPLVRSPSGSPITGTSGSDGRRSKRRVRRRALSRGERKWDDTRSPGA